MSATKACNITQFVSTQLVATSKLLSYSPLNTKESFFWDTLYVQKIVIESKNDHVKTIWVLRESVLMVIETVNDIKIIKISRSLSHSLIPGILAQCRARQSIAGHFSTLLCS